MSHITRQNIGGQRYDVANIDGREYRNKIDSPLKSAAIGTGIALAAGAGTIGAYSALNKYVGDTSWVDDAARTHGDYNVHRYELGQSFYCSRQYCHGTLVRQLDQHYIDFQDAYRLHKEHQLRHREP